MNAAPTLQGELVEGRYRIDAPVGAGGFGIVYAAWHLVLERRVAFKVLTLPETLSGAQRADRFAMFLDEAKVLARLKHPNIVEALDAGVLESPRLAAPLPYLVLGWCGRGSLSDLLAARGPLSPPEALRLLRPVVAAIAYAHDAGVVHRDLKPSNILFDDDAATVGPRVIDFGIAKVVMPDETASDGATATASTNRSFTLAYAAPEQVAGARTGPWTDVHALGLLFVRALTGRAPYGEIDARFAVIDPDRPTPRRLGIDVGPLEPILARALALRPSERFKDARAFDEAVATAMGSPSGFVPAPPPPVLPAAESTPGAAPAPGPGAATEMTAPPASRTIATRSTGSYHDHSVILASTPDRRGRRLVLLGAGVAALGAGLASLAAVLGGGEPSRRTAAPGRVEDAQPSPNKRSLASLTLDDLERLAKEAGFTIGHTREDSRGTRIVEMSRGPALQAQSFLELFRDLPPPPLESLGRILLPRRQAAAPHQAYVVEGSRALVLSAYARDNLAPFGDLVRGLSFETRGDTERAGDPAGEAAGLKVTPWSAKQVADLTAEEVASRLRAARIEIVNGPFGDSGPLPLSYAVARGSDRGEIALYRSGGAVELARRRQARQRFAFLHGGDALLVLSGGGSLSTPDLLAQIASGLDGKVASEPPM